MAITTENIAERCAEIQAQAYEHFGINSLPVASDSLEELDSWIADQLLKTSWYNLIDNDVLDCLENNYNAHEIVTVYNNLCQYR